MLSCGHRSTPRCSAGDKPELVHPAAAEELAALGHGSTLQYVAEAAGAVLRQTGLLPHVNAGVMGEADLLRLRSVSASQARAADVPLSQGATMIGDGAAGLLGGHRSIGKGAAGIADEADLLPREEALPPRRVWQVASGLMATYRMSVTVWGGGRVVHVLACRAGPSWRSGCVLFKAAASEALAPPSLLDIR